MRKMLRYLKRKMKLKGPLWNSVTTCKWWIGAMHNEIKLQASVNESFTGSVFSRWVQFSIKLSYPLSKGYVLYAYKCLISWKMQLRWFSDNAKRVIFPMKKLLNLSQHSSHMSAVKDFQILIWTGLAIRLLENPV